MVAKLLTTLLILPSLFFPNAALSSPDLLKLNSARTSFAQGNFNKAIELYSQITPQSDFWIEAIEERAWTWTRLEKYENALADLQSITSPLWKSQVGPESYVLSAYISLNLCHFKEVVTKIDLFKERMLTRVEALENISQQLKTPEFLILIKQLKSQKMTTSELGQKAELYPHYFFRDDTILTAIETQQKSLLEKRMKELAEIDLKEIKDNLKKMKIIEVQLMQTVLMQKDIKQSKQALQFSTIDNNKSLTFPVTDSEVWLDEVGQFQVKAQTCPFQKVSRL